MPTLGKSKPVSQLSTEIMDKATTTSNSDLSAIRSLQSILDTVFCSTHQEDCSQQHAISLDQEVEARASYTGCGILERSTATDPTTASTKVIEESSWFQTEFLPNLELHLDPPFSGIVSRLDEQVDFFFCTDMNEECHLKLFWALRNGDSTEVLLWLIESSDQCHYYLFYPVNASCTTLNDAIRVKKCFKKVVAKGDDLDGTKVAVQRVKADLQSLERENKFRNGPARPSWLKTSHLTATMMSIDSFLHGRNHSTQGQAFSLGTASGSH